MKKKLLLTLTIFGVFAFAGCGKKTTKTSGVITFPPKTVTKKTTKESTTTKKTTTDDKTPRETYEFDKTIKHEFEYNSNGNIIKRTSYAKIDSTYEKYNVTEFTYSDGKQSSMTFYSYYNGEMMYALKETYSYDTNINLQRAYQYDYDYDNNKFFDTYYRYSYKLFDQAGNLLQDLYFEDGWAHEQKEDYTYTDGKLTKIELYVAIDETNWKMEEKYLYIYAENTKTEEYYIINTSAGTEEKRRYIVYEYDTNGRLTKETSCGHIGSGEYMTLSTDTYEYSSNGVITQVEEGMYGKYKFVYINDSYQDRYTVKTYTWDGSGWVEADLT